MTNSVLGYRHLRALRGLLSQPTIRAAAEAAGVGERTLYRYLGDADFRAALEAARLAAEEAELDAHRDLLRQRLSLTREALHVAEELLTDPNTPPNVRAALVARFVEGSDVAADRLGRQWAARQDEARKAEVRLRWNEETRKKFYELEATFHRIEERSVANTSDTSPRSTEIETTSTSVD